MEIRKYCELEKLYEGDTSHPILENSPELLLMRAACAGDGDAAAALFCKKKLFEDVPPVIDTPYERFEGLEGIRRFAEGFVPRFKAESARIHPMIQTIAGGRVALEAAFHFIIDGAIEQVAMVIVGDFRTPRTLDEVRIYCHASQIPDFNPYRKPLFVSAHLEMNDPGLLTGAVREYYEAIHQFPGGNVKRVLNAVEDQVKFGGYWAYDPKIAEKIDFDPYHATKSELAKAYQHMGEYIPSAIIIRYETIIDDGRTCVIEWSHVVSKKGRDERNRVAMGCVAAYERGQSGKLCALRICDYAGLESRIDWARTGMTKEEAQGINYVEEMPEGCGRKGKAYGFV